MIIPRALEDLVNQEDALNEHWWEEDDDASLLPPGLFLFLRLTREFLNKYDTWLIQPHDIVLARVHHLEDEIHQIHFHCEGLSSMLGRSICVQGMEFPDVWSAIDFLAGTTCISEGENGGSSPWAELEQKVRMLSDSLHDLQTIRGQVTAAEEAAKRFKSSFCFIQPILVSVKEMSNTLQGLLA